MRKTLDFRNVRCLVFDVDGTVYPKRHPLYEEIRRRTMMWLAQRLSKTVAEAETEYRRLKSVYPDYMDRIRALGPTASDYQSGVFADLDPKLFLAKDDLLVQFLESFHGPVYAVTYALEAYASSVLNALGVDGFVRQLSAVSDETRSKGHFYRIILDSENLVPAQACVVGDNFHVDLQPAIDLGLLTVHISERPSDKASASFGDIHAFIRAFRGKT